MKKRGVLIAVLLVLPGIFIVVNQSHSSEVTKKVKKDEIVASNKSKPDKEKLKSESASLTVVLPKLSDKELYQRLGYLNEETIEEYFQGEDNEKIVFLKDGTFLSGGMINDDGVEIDSHTDPNGITIGEVKELLKIRQEALYQIRETGEVEVLGR